MKNLLSLITLVTLLLLAPLAQAAEVAGKIGYMSGSLIAKRADGTVKIMAPKSEVMAGDMLETAKDSFAQVIMNDGTKMTIRPNSNLNIEAFKFNAAAPKEDNAVFRLLKGGFRTVSGLIGKRGNPDAYQLRAVTATIGIRGTDFTTRLCNGKDCEEARTPQPVAPGILSVGRVMLLQGEATAKDAAAKVRKLIIGSPVYEGDVLNTGKGAHAVVAFRDEGRVTLQEETIFHVEKFQFKRQGTQAPTEENAALRLLKGGVRVVTGLIGRINHEKYNFAMKQATIGIRGTGFDAWCNAGCASPGGSPAATQTTPLQGAGVYVWSGQVAMSTSMGTQLVSSGQAAIMGQDLKPISVTNIPASITQNNTPRPDDVKVDQKTFDTEPVPDEAPTSQPNAKPNESTTKPAEKTTQPTETTTAEAGVYVTVHDGQVIVAESTGKTIDVNKGQTGFVNDKIITKLPSTPKFMNADKPVELNEGTTSSSNSSTAPPQTGCVVK